MRGARRAFASRANGRRSRGPTTAAGKVRHAGLVRRHGLSLPVLTDAGLAPEVDTLAREIVASVTLRCSTEGRASKGPRCSTEGRASKGGGPVDDARLALAARIAEPMIDLYRVRLAKRPLSAALDADPRDMATLKALARLDRYERRALSRRKFAIRAFAAAVATPIMEPTTPTTSS